MDDGRRPPLRTSFLWRFYAEAVNATSSRSTLPWRLSSGPIGVWASQSVAVIVPLSGTHHRGIDDARNIARIVQQTLPNVVVG
jgi:hypothetical protein